MNSVAGFDRRRLRPTLPRVAVAVALLAGAVYLISRARPAGGVIERVPSGRSDLLAFRVSGRVGKAAIHGMAEEVLQEFDETDTVDMILLMDDFRGMTLGASLDPACLWSQVRSLRKVGRYAVVAAPDIADAMITLMDPLIPVEARAFEAEEKNRAWAWVRGKD